MPCHGESGHGDGPVAHLLHAHGFDPKNLVTGVTKNLPDGYIYGYIRDGGIHMPSYGDAMNSDERWDVVMYVRQFRRRARRAIRKPPPSNRNRSSIAAGNRRARKRASLAAVAARAQRRAPARASRGRRPLRLQRMPPAAALPPGRVKGRLSDEYKSA